MKNYFDEIVSINNIKEAYNDLKEKFYNPMNDHYALSKLARGIDGDCFSIFQRHSTKKFKTIREELLSYQPSLPSIDLSIPKSSNPNKFRVISISSFKEKIKHQAVCRVIEPVLESLYADNQDEDEIKIIMRSIYLQYGQNLSCKINEQVLLLNHKVIDYCVPQIEAKMSQYFKYLKDITTMPTYIDHPVNVSSKGEKTYALDYFI